MGADFGNQGVFCPSCITPRMHGPSLSRGMVSDGKRRRWVTSEEMGNCEMLEGASKAISLRRNGPMGYS